MSTVHMSYDDYGFPHAGSPHLPTYDISYGLGGAPLHSSSIYPPSHLEASTSATRAGLLSPHLPPDRPYASFFPTQHNHYTAQQYLSGVSASLLDSHAPLFPAVALRPQSPHPRPIYDAGRPPASEHAYAPPASEWNGHVPYPAHYDPVGSAAAYVRGLTDIIDSSHTVQAQHANLVPQPPAPQHLSGSLDPTTGEFHRTIEHPRLRTAQACEKCRIRKAKCTGDSPCSRCLSRGLQCEYAPERKMRGPNKNKRGDASVKAKPRRRKDASAERFDSGSDGHVSDNELADQSSTHSSPAPPPRLIAPHVPGGRPRAATIGLGAIGRLSELNNAPAGPSSVHRDTVPGGRPRPPPLNLASEREYVPRMLAQYADAPAVVDPFSEESNSSRPASLPSYLIDSYSRISLAKPDEDSSAQTSAYDSQRAAQNMGGFLNDSPASAFAHHSCTSSSDMSGPISPISLAFEPDLRYPDSIPSDFGHFVDGVSEHSFGSNMHMYDTAHDDLLRPKSAQSMAPGGWDIALEAADRTPQGLVHPNVDQILMYP